MKSKTCKPIVDVMCKLSVYPFVYISLCFLLTHQSLALSFAVMLPALLFALLDVFFVVLAQTSHVGGVFRGASALMSAREECKSWEELHVDGIKSFKTPNRKRIPLLVALLLNVSGKALSGGGGHAAHSQMSKLHETLNYHWLSIVVNNPDTDVSCNTNYQ